MRSRRRPRLRNEFEHSAQIFCAECSKQWLSAQYFRSIIQRNYHAEREAYYRERSPLTRAARVTTPTLFLHPEVDLRCPIEQSEQFYMTLKMMGKVPVEFVRVPAAWHVGTTKPGQWFAYWEKALEWFRRYVEIRPEEYMNKL